MQLSCPSCRIRLNVPEASSGKKSRCPACKQVFLVPGNAIASATAPLIVSQSSPPPLSFPLPAASPPYFHGVRVYGLRPNRLYRIYLLPEELVFIYVGSGEDYSSIAAQGAMQGGAIGALIGKLIAAALNPKKKIEKRQAILDNSNVDELIHEHKHSFRVDLNEISNVSIDPPSGWLAAGYNQHGHVGVLRFAHPTTGKVRLCIKTVEELAVAVDKLSGRLAGQVAVNLKLDEIKAAPAGNAKAHRTWLLGAFLALLFAIGFYIQAGREHELRELGSTPAAEISLKQLLAEGPGAKRHIRIVDFVFGSGYAAETGRFGSWKSVWIPLYPAEDARPGMSIGWVVKSSHITNEAEINEFVQRRSVTGIVSTSKNPFGTSVADQLKQVNQGAHVQAWELDELRDLPSETYIWVLYIGAVLCLVAIPVFVGIYWIKRPKYTK